MDHRDIVDKSGLEVVEKRVLFCPYKLADFEYSHMIWRAAWWTNPTSG